MAIEKNNALSQILKETTPLDSPLDDETVTLTEFDDGSLEFEFGEIEDEGDDDVTETDNFYENLAESIISEEQLSLIASECKERFDADQISSKDFLDNVKAGLNLLGLKMEENNSPFPGACGAHHPLILESAVKFQARASNEIFGAKGPVNTQILGKITPEKEQQANRVRNHMNYQVTQEIEEYFSEQERMLFMLPIVGTCFKKIYYNYSKKRPVSEFVPLDRLVVAYTASNLNTAPSFTHIIPVSHADYLKDVASGFYCECNLGSPTSYPDEGELTQEMDKEIGFTPSELGRTYTFLEQHTYLHIDEDPLKDPDGVPLPYVVTFDQDSLNVLSIRRGWDKDDETKQRDQCFVDYNFVPGMGFYSLGYIHLLGNLQLTLTSTLRSLIDSGAFANLNAGFVDKRLRIRNDGPLSPGQFREVESGGLPLDQAIKLIPFKEPSVTLMNMYKFVEERSQKFADTAEQVISESTNYGPVGTTMALLEASSRFFSGVHKRLHRSQRQEFKILAKLNHRHLEDSVSFDVVGESFEIKRSDYDGRVDVIPESDPNITSQAQRAAQAQAIYTAALQNPGIHDMVEVTKEYYRSLGIEETKIDMFIPDKENQAVEADPVTDLINAQAGKPIKAFVGQNHDAHIQIKSAFLQDPQSGATPFFANLAPIIQANIQEHALLKFRESVSGVVAQTGNQASPDQQAMDSEMVVAQAAQRVAQMNAQIQELQAKGIDEAKNKIADAELLRAQNEGRDLQLRIMEAESKKMLDYMKFQSDNALKEFKAMLDAVKVDIQTQKDQVKVAQDVLNSIKKETPKDQP